MDKGLVFDKYEERYFIPFNRETIIEMLFNDGGISISERDNFKQFCRILKSIYHFEFHKKLENLKVSYKSYNPNTENTPLQNKHLTLESENNFINSITELLNDGNYTEIPLHRLGRTRLRFHQQAQPDPVPE